MGRRLNKTKIKWSSEFAYAIGLLTTDGNLSSDGRHINFTSKDKELAEIFKNCLNLDNKIGRKARGGEKEKKYFVIQFGDINFYNFLIKLGLSAKKSKIVGRLDVPDEYFFDFLRGHFDGDGTFYSYWDPRWKSSFMFYTIFLSASKEHVYWLQSKIYGFLKIKGYITKSAFNSCYSLRYAKKETLKLLSKMYYDMKVISLSRKRLKIQKALSVIGKEI